MDLRALKSEVQRIKMQKKAESQPCSMVLTELPASISSNVVIVEVLNWAFTTAAQYNTSVDSVAMAFASGSLFCRLVTFYLHTAIQNEMLNYEGLNVIDSSQYQLLGRISQVQGAASCIQ